jgi:hypothetical protein
MVSSPERFCAFREIRDAVSFLKARESLRCFRSYLTNENILTNCLRRYCYGSRFGLKCHCRPLYLPAVTMEAASSATPIRRARHR